MNHRPARDTLVRLSSYVLFVDYGAEVELQHTLRGTVCRIDRHTYEDLLPFCRFRTPSDRHAIWRDAGVLVPPFRDRPEHHGGLRAGTEAQLGRDYQAWYWRREVEAEREYRWLGQSLVKMPSDLFFYQELLAARRIDAVLELGYGAGGGLWFFATILSLLRGGLVVGVDLERSTDLPPFETLPGVRVELLHGDAHQAATVDVVRAVRPAGFGLVVVDADPQPEGKVALLARWASAVAPGGYLLVEDVESPECLAAGGLVEDGLDTFLLADRRFGLAVEASRFPLLKARGVALRRLQ
ncbi:CmcI family methyltransferase [Chondromyces apiculatus]|uniref:Cephalosporin hydroxylase n=1 Tax=Chondromyces apiculatus DSM 436 TaxID=1192034 RepID=A0A017TI28_9BACT|nr:CmcI family methyltransferase [Chondromyces apiculatus]EYF08276.1 Cephalosporin hydroxylase [Chondromyces apiculatus DSM 436]